MQVSAQVSAQVSRPRKEMWTEITKDLVVKEAIEMFGCEYEETEAFYYVMDYLKYVCVSHSLYAVYSNENSKYRSSVIAPFFHFILFHFFYFF